MKTFTSSSFGLSRPAGDLIRALCAIEREQVSALALYIVPLLTHSYPEVRAEALSALFVTGHFNEYRAYAVRALSRDADEGVRAKAAYALVATLQEETRRDDVLLLLRVVQNTYETSNVRRAAYEALFLILGRCDFPSSSAEFDPINAVDWAWIKEIEALYGQGYP